MIAKSHCLVPHIIPGIRHDLHVPLFPQDIISSGKVSPVGGMANDDVCG